ncbi:hypothetical protein EYF80_046954 [Liparis tanakae]|uniref:Uncharacterized protein n=1 Tax=Liparis tanakae TaxID=230148 RepID=A0A4Z2FNP2_9TELE|nr:hypothetical protein EYF80_046954 [Liparis tanakae]
MFTLPNIAAGGGIFLQPAVKREGEAQYNPAQTCFSFMKLKQAGDDSQTRRHRDKNLPKLTSGASHSHRKDAVIPRFVVVRGEKQQKGTRTPIGTNPGADTDVTARPQRRNAKLSGELLWFHATFTSRLTLVTLVNLVSSRQRLNFRSYDFCSRNHVARCGGFGLVR